MWANLFPHFTNQFELVNLFLIANSYLIYGIILSLKHTYRAQWKKELEENIFNIQIFILSEWKNYENDYFPCIIPVFIRSTFIIRKEYLKNSWGRLL